MVCTVKLTQEMSRRRQHEDASLWLWRQRDDFELFETSSILPFGVLPGSTALVPGMPRVASAGAQVVGMVRKSTRMKKAISTSA